MSLKWQVKMPVGVSMDSDSS